MSSSYFVANFLSIAIAISIVIYFYRRHQASRYHVDAVQAISLPQKDVGEMLSHAHSEEKRLNGQMLMIILQNLQFLGRQGIALRGHDQDESNFIQLVKLRRYDQHVSSLDDYTTYNNGDSSAIVIL